MVELREDELPDLQLRIRDDTSRETSIGRPIQTAVENVLAPAVPIVLVDVVHVPVFGHDFVWVGTESMRASDDVAQEDDRVRRIVHDTRKFCALEFSVQFVFFLAVVCDDDRDLCSVDVENGFDGRGKLAMRRRQEMVCRVDDRELRKENSTPRVRVGSWTNVDVLSESSE